MRSLLDGVTPGDIRKDPFPHVIVDEALDPETRDALRRSFPSYESIGCKSSSQPPSNVRVPYSTWQVLGYSSLPSVWRDFVTYHSSPAFFEEVATLFQGHWDPALLEALGGSLLGHSMGRLQMESHAEAQILQDVRLELNTPVHGKPSTHRGTHLDTQNRLFTCLYYLRAEDDDTPGGELELSRWTGEPPPNINAFQFPSDLVEQVATVPYRANQMIIFPQNINALHGVSLRDPNPHTRQYVFITAEIEEDWLSSPTPFPSFDQKAFSVAAKPQLILSRKRVMDA